MLIRTSCIVVIVDMYVSSCDPNYRLIEKHKDTKLWWILLIKFPQNFPIDFNGIQIHICSSKYPQERVLLFFEWNSDAGWLQKGSWCVCVWMREIEKERDCVRVRMRAKESHSEGARLCMRACVCVCVQVCVCVCVCEKRLQSRIPLYVRIFGWFSYYWQFDRFVLSKKMRRRPLFFDYRLIGSLSVPVVCNLSFTIHSSESCSFDRFNWAGPE